MSFVSEVVTAIRGVSGITEVYSTPASGGESTVPTDAVAPYVRLTREFGRSPILAGDSATMATRRQFQVSLWQEVGAEDDLIADALLAALDGLKITEAGYGHVIFEFGFRLEEREGGYAQHAWTFSVPVANNV